MLVPVILCRRIVDLTQEQRDSADHGRKCSECSESVASAGITEAMLARNDPPRLICENCFPLAAALARIEQTQESDISERQLLEQLWCEIGRIQIELHKPSGSYWSIRVGCWHLAVNGSPRFVEFEGHMLEPFAAVALFNGKPAGWFDMDKTRFTLESERSVKALINALRWYEPECHTAERRRAVHRHSMGPKAKRKRK